MKAGKKRTRARAMTMKSGWIKRGKVGIANKEMRERRRMTANKETQGNEKERQWGKKRRRWRMRQALPLSSLSIQYSTKVHSIHPYTLAHETPRDVCKWLVTNDLVIPVLSLPLLSLPAAVSVQALYDVVRPFEPGRLHFPCTSSLDAFALSQERSEDERKFGI